MQEENANIKAPDPVRIGTAICTHIPSDPAKYVGQTTKCKLCGVSLVCGNPPPGTHPRMSKKQRRLEKLKRFSHALAMAMTEKAITGAKDVTNT